MSVGVEQAKQTEWLERLIKQLQENVVKCVVEIEGVVIQKLEQQHADFVVMSLNKILEHLDNTKTQIQSKITIMSVNNHPSDPLLITPKKSFPSHSKHVTFDFTSYVKTTQDFESLASANDSLFKQCEEMLEKYRYNKQTLSHENQIVLSQWIENTNHISSATNLGKGPKKSTFFSLVKSLIQELSKYESVEEYINTVEQIQHNKIVFQLRAASSETNDLEKKWFKETTKDYLLKMAQLLRNQENFTTDDQEIEDIHAQDLKSMF